MAKNSKVDTVEIGYAGKCLYVNFFRKTNRKYLLGRTRINNLYAPVTRSSQKRINDLLLKRMFEFHAFPYTVIGYRRIESEE